MSIFPWILLSILLFGLLATASRAGADEARVPAPLTIEEARVAVTGHDVNRPDPFPGLGEFSWPGNIQRLDNGELLLVHSAGYAHVSFAEPRLTEENTRQNWLESGWDLDFSAPTGGRCMLTRSTDQGATWSKPETILDLPWDDRPYGLLRCPDGTLLCFINAQSSWYGFPKAPEPFRNILDGLNTQQCVIRSQDDGKTWSPPILLESPGNFYERSDAQPLLLSDGGILWPTYCKSTDRKHLFGAIHRSDDYGQTWRTLTTIQREGDARDVASDHAGNVDESALALLPDGRLMLTCRPDGASFYSSDEGVTWTRAGHLVNEGKFKAPSLYVLQDGTVVCVCTYQNLCVFLGRNGRESWTGPLPLDPSSYGYPGGLQLEDDSILVSYCSAGRAPNRVYVVRFRVNEARDGLELLPLNKPLSARQTQPETASLASAASPRLVGTPSSHRP